MFRHFKYLSQDSSQNKVDVSTITPTVKIYIQSIAIIAWSNYMYHDISWHYDDNGKLDMSTARRRLKSPRSLSGTSAHPTVVTLVNIMVMNGWLRCFSFHVIRPPYSWDKAISDSDLETPRSMSRVWSKGKVIQSAQYHINSLPFRFTSIRPTNLEIELF